MNLAEIRHEITKSGDPQALAMIYLADTIDAGLSDIAKSIDNLGTSVENGFNDLGRSVENT